MKAAFLIILLFIVNAIRANTYYFSTSIGDDSRSPAEARNPKTPWKSINKLNAFFPQLGPGDSILFKRGDEFYGSIILGVSGTKMAPIVLSAYGSGNRPVISGLTRLSDWQAEQAGIWSSPCANCGSKVNLLIINDSSFAMGRWPNAGNRDAGYRSISSHAGHTSITDSNLAGDINWTGADLVMRKNRFIIDRSRITNSQGTNISYEGGSFYEPTNKFGYFIQNHLQTLDVNGEWYFDNSSKKMYLFNAAGNPKSLVISAATIDTLIFGRKMQFIIFDQLSLRGANYNAFSFINCDHLTISNCDLTYSGMDAVHITSSNNIVIDGNKILKSNNDAIAITGSENLIGHNKIETTGMNAGMGGNENSYSAITINGEHNLVAFNEINHTGYIPILFLGNQATIKNNLVNGFAIVKDDGGGIYTWSGKSSAQMVQLGATISENIIMNGICASAGTDGAEGIADGIYLDDNSGGINVFGNTVSACKVGLYLHNTHDIMATNNTLYGNGIQFYIKQDLAKFDTRNNFVHQNTMVSMSEKQLLVQLSSLTDQLADLGDLDSNYYVHAGKNAFSFVTYVASKHGSMAVYNAGSWQSNFHFDLHSKLANWPVKSYTVIGLTATNKIANGNFDQNIQGPSFYAPDGKMETKWTEGVLDGGALSISFLPGETGPSSRNSAVNFSVGQVQANNNYILKFSLKGSKTGGVMGVLIRKSEKPYTILTLLKKIYIGAERSENEVLFETSSTEANATLAFFFDPSDSTSWIDNIGLFEAKIRKVNLEDYIRLSYNATAGNKTFPLDHTYTNAAGKTFGNSFSLPAYRSQVLLRKDSQ